MSFEMVAETGQRIRVPRGWVILTLTLACWGVVSIIGLSIWGLFQLFV